MEFNPNDLLKLAEMLQPPKEIPQDPETMKTEYEITNTRRMEKSAKVKDGIMKAGDQPKTIEEFEEQQEREFEEKSCFDGRREPEYSMVYRQAVSAEDVYLQMGPKTPSSACCENLVVRVVLNGAVRENVILKVTKTSVDVQTTQYNLHLPLPHAIDPDASKAAWDTDSDTLILTLKLEREFDYINF